VLRRLKWQRPECCQNVEEKTKTSPEEIKLIILECQFASKTETQIVATNLMKKPPYQSESEFFLQKS
jgi:predicted aconitase